MANYKATRDEYSGAQTTEVSITRVGGATDGATPQSDKIVTNAQAAFLTPFRMLPLAIWNDTTGADVTVTLYGTVNAGSLPLNDEIWMDLQYLGDAGGAYTTWNPADSLNLTFSSGNLKITSTSSGPGGSARSTMGQTTGKYYWEVSCTLWTANSWVGIATAGASHPSNVFIAGTNSAVNSTGAMYANGSGVGSLGSRSNGDIIGIAVDLDARLIWFRVAPSGNWNGSGTANPATGVGGINISALSGTLFPYSSLFTSGDNVTANFGASAFSGAVPSGFTAGWVRSTASPLASFKSTCKSHPLAAGTAVASDGSSWNNASSGLLTFDPTTVVFSALTNSNLTLTHTNQTANGGARTLQGQSAGKFYYEIRYDATFSSTGDGAGVLLSSGTFTDLIGSGANCFAVYVGSGNIWVNGANSGKTVGTVVVGNVVGIAVDLTAHLGWIRRGSGNWNGDPTANPATGVGGVTLQTGVFDPAAGFGSAVSAGSAWTANFGQSAYANAAPSGFGNWSIVWSPFKLVATLNSPQPAQRGYIYARVLAAKPSTTYYIDPQLSLSSSGGVTTGPCPVKVTRDEYAGSQVTETTITRTGGAATGGIPVSTKIATNAQATFFTPYRMLPLAIWNDVVAADRTVTLYGTVNAGALPNNDEIWMDVQYLGDAGGLYATWDVASVTAVALSGGNLVATNTGTTSLDQGARVASAFGQTAGKYYFEVTVTAINNQAVSVGFGICAPTSTYTNMGTNAVGGVDIYRIDGGIWTNGGGSGVTLGGLSVGVPTGVAVDLDNRKIWFRVTPSGNWNNSGTANPATNVGGIAVPGGMMTPFCSFGGSGGVVGEKFTANFGASAFTGAVPSGFTAGWAKSTASPLASFKSTSKTHPLANGAAVASDGSTWNGMPAYATLDGTLTAGVVMSNGSLTATHGTTNTAGATSTAVLVSGKYYFEVTVGITNSSNSIGLIRPGTAFSDIVTAPNFVRLHGSTQIYVDGVNTSKTLGVTFTNGDVYCFALDLDSHLFWVKKAGGNWNGDPTANPATGIGGISIPSWSLAPYVHFAAGTASTNFFTANFGQSSYVNAAPSGFSNWAIGYTPFKLVATLNSPSPQQKGYIYTRVLAAKASTNYYIDPQPVLS